MYFVDRIKKKRHPLTDNACFETLLRYYFFQFAVGKFFDRNFVDRIGTVHHSCVKE
jgi:hypothetical protein